MTSIRDLCLPVIMTRLDYNISYWIMTGIVVYKIRFDDSAEEDDLQRVLRVNRSLFFPPTPENINYKAFSLERGR